VDATQAAGAGEGGGGDGGGGTAAGEGEVESLWRSAEAGLGKEAEAVQEGRGAGVREAPAGPIEMASQGSQAAEAAGAAVAAATSTPPPPPPPATAPAAFTTASAATMVEAAGSTSLPPVPPSPLRSASPLPTSSPPAYLAGAAAGWLALGPPDCQLAGWGWSLPAHRGVLQARCELLRAQLLSGMRDSHTTRYVVPEAVERREAVEAFLHYVYLDCLPPGGVDSHLMPQLIHAGIYYGCNRLVRLCESLLARELVAASEAAAAAGGEEEGAAGGSSSSGTQLKQESAAGTDGGAAPPHPRSSSAVLAAAVAAAGPLLALADEGGLDQLRSVALQFILDHYPAVSASEGFRQLPPHLVAAVAAEAVGRYRGLLGQLERLA
ncbi:hypothetical protein Agub_g12668, partial [Astrephomene gubernaculifera]